MVEKLWKSVVDTRGLSFLTPVAWLMWIVAGIYRCLFALSRMFAGSPRQVGIPVISVGNITVGGTGKTPMVEFLARDLIREGYRVGIVSSGYARPDETSFVEPGYKVEAMSVEQTGDEVMFLAQRLPEAIFAVDKSKTQAAEKLAQNGSAEIIIVDDGYQHWGLHRDVNIVTYDAGIRKHWLKPFPRGVLRESRPALSRADVIVVTRAKFAKDIGKLTSRLQALSPRAQMFAAQFSADELMTRDARLSSKYLEDKSVFLFAGVGNFRALRKQVAALAGDLDCAMELSDHQKYTPEVLEEIKMRAAQCDSDLILTTAKDWVKLGDFDFGREICYLCQRIDLDPGEEKLIRYLKDKLKLPDRTS